MALLGGRAAVARVATAAAADIVAPAAAIDALVVAAAKSDGTVVCQLWWRAARCARMCGAAGGRAIGRIPSMLRCVGGYTGRGNW